ncbi:hypothetical protein KKF34_12060, partial [Myxococcota bacterium]|nr:hypothetical protein [Myxococcota bacterium]MBU1379797.1 hypothetical protein [Myxococcota bacterium]MBU1497598.1 hypothetical protein [Myxococcota bacterium]
CPEIRFAKNFIKNSIRPLVIFSTPCGYCPEQKIGEKFDFGYFRTVTKYSLPIEGSFFCFIRSFITSSQNYTDHDHSEITLNRDDFKIQLFLVLVCC